MNFTQILGIVRFNLLAQKNEWLEANSRCIYSSLTFKG